MTLTSAPISQHLLLSDPLLSGLSSHANKRVRSHFQRLPVISSSPLPPHAQCFRLASRSRSPLPGTPGFCAERAPSRNPESLLPSPPHCPGSEPRRLQAVRARHRCGRSQTSRPCPHLVPLRRASGDCPVSPAGFPMKPKQRVFAWTPRYVRALLTLDTFPLAASTSRQSVRLSVKSRGSLVIAGGLWWLAHRHGTASSCPVVAVSVGRLEPAWQKGYLPHLCCPFIQTRRTPII